MSKLDELIKETDYSTEEWKAHQKVVKNCNLWDLHDLLEELLEREDITQEQYDLACENADIIVEKYDKWLDYDWRTTMSDAIDYILFDK